MINFFCRVCLFIFLSTQSAFAFIEANVFYLSDTLTAATSSTSTKTFFEICLGFSIDSKGKYMVGWNYGSFATSDTTTTTDTYTSTQMGPRFVFQFGKGNDWSVGLAYNISTKAAYTPAGGTQEDWTGTGLKADFGYNFQLSEYTDLGIRLNYASATYTEKVVAQTTYSTISYTRPFIYPSVYFIYNYH